HADARVDSKRQLCPRTVRKLDQRPRGAPPGPDRHSKRAGHLDGAKSRNDGPAPQQPYGAAPRKARVQRSPEGQRVYSPGAAPMRAVVLCLLLASPLRAQSFTQRGFLEATAIFYPQSAPGDSGHIVAEALFRYEAFYQPASGLRFAGAIDARADTHEQTER